MISLIKRKGNLRERTITTAVIWAAATLLGYVTFWPTTVIAILFGTFFIWTVKVYTDPS